jgi:DHA3 family macrolide efflux protein-like MFS transporter
MPFPQPKGMKAFVLVWIGQVISLMGSAMSGFALTIWAWKATNSATAMAIVGICNFLPGLLFSPIAGALVDRWNRKVVMILSDLTAGLTTVGILIIYAINPENLQIWHLCAAGVISGTFQAFQWPAYSAAISVLVPKKQYARSAGMMSLAEWGSGVFAPVLAGTLIGVIGLVGILFIDIVTFIFAIVMVLWISIPSPKVSPEGKESQGNLWQESLFGFKYIFTRRPLFFLQMVFFIGNLLASLGFTLFAPMILARTNDDAAFLGVIQAAGSIGGIAGSVLISTWGGPKKRIHGVILGWVGCGLLGMLIMGFSQSLLFWLIGSFFGAFFGPIINSSNQAIWQSKVPPDIQGKVFSVRRVIAQIVGPLGMAIAGPLADKVMEPAMSEGGALVPILGSIFGSGKGVGMSIIISVMGILTVIICLSAYLNPLVRNVEKIITDHDQLTEEKKENG